jgi:hypothetical protein
LEISRLTQDFARDDGALDLVGALVYLRDLGVAVEALHFEAANEAGAAENLYGIRALGDRDI